MMLVASKIDGNGKKSNDSLHMSLLVGLVSHAPRVHSDEGLSLWLGLGHGFWPQGRLRRPWQLWASEGWPRSSWQTIGALASASVGHFLPRRPPRPCLRKYSAFFFCRLLKGGPSPFPFPVPPPFPPR